MHVLQPKKTRVNIDFKFWWKIYCKFIILRFVCRNLCLPKFPKLWIQVLQVWYTNYNFERCFSSYHERGTKKKFWVTLYRAQNLSSLWLSGRASERGILKSEVRFLMGTQNFFFVPRSRQNEKHLSLFLNRAQNLPSLLFLIIIFSNRNRMPAESKNQVFVSRPKPSRERQFHGLCQYRKIEILLTFCRNRKNRLRARRNIADHGASWDFIVLYLKVDWLDLKMVESLV